MATRPLHHHRLPSIGPANPTSQPQPIPTAQPQPIPTSQPSPTPNRQSPNRPSPDPAPRYGAPAARRPAPLRRRPAPRPPPAATCWRGPWAPAAHSWGRRLHVRGYECVRVFVCEKKGACLGFLMLGAGRQVGTSQQRRSESSGIDQTKLPSTAHTSKPTSHT